MFSLAYDDRCEIAVPGHQQSRGPRMPLVWSSVVRCSTQTIAILKKSADITHPYLTPIVILKLSILTSAREVVVNAFIEKK